MKAGRIKSLYGDNSVRQHKRTILINIYAAPQHRLVVVFANQGIVAYVDAIGCKHRRGRCGAEQESMYGIVECVSHDTILFARLGCKVQLRQAFRIGGYIAGHLCTVSLIVKEYLCTGKRQIIVTPCYLCNKMIPRTPRGNEIHLILTDARTADTVDVSLF